MSAAGSSRLHAFSKIHSFCSVLDNIYFSMFSQPLSFGRQAQDSESLLNSKPFD